MTTITGSVPPSSGTPSFSLQPVQFNPRRVVDLSLIDVGLLQKENEKIVNEIQLLSDKVSSIGTSIEESSQEIKATQRKIEGVSGQTFDNTQSILRNQKESHQKIDLARREISTLDGNVRSIVQRQESTEQTLGHLVEGHNNLVNAFKASDAKLDTFMQEQREMNQKILSALQSK